MGTSKPALCFYVTLADFRVSDLLDMCLKAATGCVHINYAVVPSLTSPSPFLQTPLFLPCHLREASSDYMTHPLVATALVSLILWLIARLVQRALRKFPPGPKGLPLIGDVPHAADLDWLSSPQRRDDYGDTLDLQYILTFAHPSVSPFQVN
jgi:hypothetical protein